MYVVCTSTFGWCAVPDLFQGFLSKGSFPSLNCCISLEPNRLVPEACLAMFSFAPQPQCQSVKQTHRRYRISSGVRHKTNLAAHLSASAHLAQSFDKVCSHQAAAGRTCWLAEGDGPVDDGGGPAAKRRRTRINQLICALQYCTPYSVASKRLLRLFEAPRQGTYLGSLAK